MSIAFWMQRNGRHVEHLNKATRTYWYADNAKMIFETRGSSPVLMYTVGRENRMLKMHTNCQPMNDGKSYRFHRTTLPIETSNGTSLCWWCWWYLELTIAHFSISSNQMWHREDDWVGDVYGGYKAITIFKVRNWKSVSFKRTPESRTSARTVIVMERRI